MKERALTGASEKGVMKERSRTSVLIEEMWKRRREEKEKEEEKEVFRRKRR